MGELRRDHPLDAFRTMLLEALGAAIPDQLDRLEGIHLRPESDELDDFRHASLILHQPNLRLLALEVGEVVEVARFKVAQVQQLASVDNILVDDVRLQLIHERVCIGEEELGIVPILGLHEVVVDAVGRHGTQDIVPMQKDVKDVKR